MTVEDNGGVYFVPALTGLGAPTGIRMQEEASWELPEVLKKDISQGNLRHCL